jgi:hypothetical protein
VYHLREAQARSRGADARGGAAAGHQEEKGKAMSVFDYILCGIGLLFLINAVWTIALLRDDRRQNELHIRQLKRSAKFFKSNPRFLL